MGGWLALMSGGGSGWLAPDNPLHMHRTHSTPRLAPPRPARATCGFTLIEIMIAVALVAILAAVALPTFQNSIRKSRRTDAFTALTAVQQAQERWRGNHAAYADNSQLALAVNAVPPGLGLSATTPGDRYAIAIAAVGAATYNAIATAQNAQAADAGCQQLGVMVAGGNLTFASGTSSVDFAASAPDANRCWAR